ncbi:MAG TPA: polysaccharide deacetylase family protein [Dehalococcoidia bacterium]|nr:polysaccharide deacetylase family protein [Dehalococcoidia bacterium]
MTTLAAPPTDAATTTLQLLGYAPDDRVLIIHADDVGFSHASNVAAFEAMSAGSLTCCSTLVPAPWFMETAALQRQHPGADIGIHMTLTAEYETYRWRSLTGRPSLHAPDGGMWRDVASVVAHVSTEDARAELRAQVEHALASGIDVTHLDTHMGAVIGPKYIAPYVDLAVEFRLPLFFIRPSDRRLDALGDGAAAYLEQARRLDALGWPLLDHAIHRTLSEIEPDDKDARFREFFAGLRPGLTHFLVHPAKGGEELDAMTPADCRHRAKEYELFRRPDLRAYCESLGIKLTGYREIRDRLRASLKATA